MNSNELYLKISGLFPRSVVATTEKLMIEAGFAGITARTYIGFSVFFSFCFSLLFFFVMPFFTGNPLLQAMAPIIGLAISSGLFFLLLEFNADNRAQSIESVLPDALQLIASNIRAGMTLENAIWSAARPEFGFLSDEIKRVSADTFSGKPIDLALLKMTRHVRSPVLERAVKLIVEGIRLGGEMANLLEAVSEDIRGTQMLRKEIMTSTMMYAIFIIFAAVIAGPLLFSISTVYAEMNENLLQKQANTNAGGDVSQAAQASGISGLPGMSKRSAPTADSITAQDIFWFSVGTIFITTFCASLTLALIQSGKPLRGLKYAPIFVIVGLCLYMGAHEMLKGLLGTMLK